MNRRKLKALAAETLTILETGQYSIGESRYYIGEEIEESIERSRFIDAETACKIREESVSESGKLSYDYCRVAAMSTVEALYAITEEHKGNRGILNFASALSPGGGFLLGSNTQEDLLAYSSSMYAAQVKFPEYYNANKLYNNPLYTECAIFSPNVVFFRNGDYSLRTNAVASHVLTLPAVNMKEVKRKRMDVKNAERVMRERMKLSLALFHYYGARNIILGAYGCGAFGNDIRKVAWWWRELLQDDFSNKFESVTFAVPDEESRKVFQTALVWDGT